MNTVYKITSFVILTFTFIVPACNTNTRDTSGDSGKSISSNASTASETDEIINKQILGMAEVINVYSSKWYSTFGNELAAEGEWRVAFRIIEPKQYSRIEDIGVCDVGKININGHVLQKGDIFKFSASEYNFFMRGQFCFVFDDFTLVEIIPNIKIKNEPTGQP